MAILKAAYHIYFSVCFIIKYSIIKNPYGDSSGTSGSKQFPYCGHLMLRSPLPWPGFVCPLASTLRPIRLIKWIFSNRPRALKPLSISPTLFSCVVYLLLIDPHSFTNMHHLLQTPSLLQLLVSPSSGLGQVLLIEWQNGQLGHLLCWTLGSRRAGPCLPVLPPRTQPRAWHGNHPT